MWLSCPSEADQQNTTYTGTGGVNIGSFARKAADAITYREVNSPWACETVSRHLSNTGTVIPASNG